MHLVQRTWKWFTGEMEDHPRLKRGVAATSLALACGGLILAVLYVFDIGGTKPAPVETSFTRLGGPTRFETALEAARFWHKAPDYVVEVGEYAKQQSIFGAARCAMRVDSPLLFVHLGRRNPAVNKMVSRLRKESPKPVRELLFKGHCPDDAKTYVAKRLSLFDIGDRPSGERLQVPLARTIAPFVIVVAAKSPTDEPDLAIGLVLGRHLEDTRGRVSVVVAPRQPLTSSDAERRLRDQHTLVRGGLLLGGDKIVSDDGKTFLREVLRAPAPRGWLGSLQSLWSAGGTFVVAALTLLGIIFAVPTLRRLAETTGSGDRRQTSNGGASTMPDNKDVRPDWAGWFKAKNGAPVTVWLDDGERIEGNVDTGTGVPKGTVRLREATVARSPRRPQEEAEELVIALRDIVRVAADPDTALRRRSRKLVASVASEIHSGAARIGADRNSLLTAIIDAAGLPLERPPEALAELPKMIEDPETAGDDELLTALRAVDEARKSFEEAPGSRIRRDFLEALEDLAIVASRPVTQTAPQPAVTTDPASP